MFSYPDICSRYFRSRHLLVSQSFFHTTACCSPWSSVSSCNIATTSSCLSSFINIISLCSLIRESSIDLSLIQRLRICIGIGSLLTIRQFLFFLDSFKRTWCSSTHDYLLSHHHPIFFPFFYYLIRSDLIDSCIYLIIITTAISSSLSLWSLFFKSSYWLCWWYCTSTLLDCPVINIITLNSTSAHQVFE